MKQTLLGLLVLASSTLAAAERLDSKYCISYGEPSASVEVYAYFSFTCPHCISFFQQDFQRVRERYIDSGLVHWVFHPVPGDMQTAQAMACLGRLDERQRQVFLEAVLPSIDLQFGDVNTRIMQLAMQHFDVVCPPIDQLDELVKESVFQDAYAYVQQDDAVRDIPTVEINGRVYEDVPTLPFLIRRIDLLVQGGS